MPFLRVLSFLEARKLTRQAVLEASLLQSLPQDALLYFCLQSVFKLHPSFDSVLAAVLRQLPNAHLLFLRGRRQDWTALTLSRWRKTMPDVVGKHSAYPLIATRSTGTKLTCVWNAYL
jgi:hypothetical protein